MANLVISTNMTVDGVVEDPDGADGSERGGWFERFGGADLEPWRAIEYDEALRADALLLGRRSHEWFASRWASRPGEWADRLRVVPKYVVTSTPLDTSWSNSTVIGDDVIDSVVALKEQVAGDLVVYASYELGRTLFDHGLVDEVRLFVFPVVAGAGNRLFGESAGATALRLLSNRTVGHGLAQVIYEVIRPATA